MATYAAGTIVLFYHQAGLCLGIVTAPEGNRWQVLDPEGELHLLGAERFVLSSLDSYLPNQMQTLRNFAGLVEQALDLLAAEDVPAQLSQLSSPFSFEQASAAASCLSDFCRFALYLHLRQREDIYLLKKGLWRMRDAEEISAYLAQKKLDEARTRYLEWVAGCLERLGETAKDASTGPDPDEFRGGFHSRLATELRGLLLASEPKDLAKILRAGGRDLDASVRALRLRLGDIAPDTDPVAAASGIPIGFAPGLAAQALAAEHSEIEDCEAFTIDAEDSTDLDDAITWQETASGWRLGVHISDVAARIPLRSELWSAAQDRVASLYLPSQTIPLLPGELSGDRFSLRQAEARPVLSLWVNLDREARIVDYHWRRGLVRVSENLSYEKVDRQLREQERSPLLDLCRKLHDARVGEAEERKSRYIWNLKVTDGDITLQRVDNFSPARFIIEELMVLYNRLLAEHARQAGLPLIFRNVTQFADEEDEGYYGIQAYLSTEAKYHPGVGAQAYLHATSPIRRFTDIVNQAQFSTMLEGGSPLYSREQLRDLIPDIEQRLRLLRAVSQRSERYWLLQFLRQKHMQEPLDAVALRQVKQGWVVELSRWEKRLVLRCEAAPPLNIPLKLVVSAVDLAELTVSGDVIL